MRVYICQTRNTNEYNQVIKPHYAIFAHNHPSGVAEPSHADETLTQALKEALALIDVRVLDHFVVGRGATLSFAERGLL